MAYVEELNSKAAASKATATPEILFRLFSAVNSGCPSSLFYTFTIHYNDNTDTLIRLDSAFSCYRASLLNRVMGFMALEPDSLGSFKRAIQKIGTSLF